MNALWFEVTLSRRSGRFRGVRHRCMFDCALFLIVCSEIVAFDNLNNNLGPRRIVYMAASGSSNLHKTRPTPDDNLIYDSHVVCYVQYVG